MDKLEELMMYRDAWERRGQQAISKYLDSKISRIIMDGVYYESNKI